MGTMKRLLLIVFVLSAIIGIGYLILLQVPFREVVPAVEWLGVQPWFTVVELILLGIVAIGVIAAILWAIFSPTKSSRLIFMQGNNEVAITRDLVRSAVRHVVDSHSGMKTEKVRMKVQGNANEPKMNLTVKIDPGRNRDLAVQGVNLTSSIKTSVETLTGYPLNKVAVKFTKTEHASPSVDTTHQDTPPRTVEQADMPATASTN